jgi:hypothetical protein
METLLDSQIPTARPKIYTLLAFIISILTLSIFVYSILVSEGVIVIHKDWRWHYYSILTTIKYFSIAGMIFTVLSILKKEPVTLLKWISIILNIVLFILIFGLIAFALWFKYYRQ